MTTEERPTMTETTDSPSHAGKPARKATAKKAAAPRKAAAKKATAPAKAPKKGSGLLATEGPTGYIDPDDGQWRPN